MAVVITGSNTPTAGGVVYGDGSTYATTTAGTSGRPVVSGGAGAPTFRPYTLPAADGSANQVLQTDGAGALSFATPSSGAMTLITTTTASSSATVDFTGLTSTYKNYVVIVTNAVPATNNAALYLRTSTNNGSSFDTGASDYYSTGTNFGNTTWNYLAVPDSQGYMNASGMVNNTTQGGTSFTLTLVNPSGATRTQWYLTGFENGNFEVGAFTRGGYRLATTGAVNAIRFFYNSGNIASGTFKLYGIS
jgi:hypothetical protein